MQDAEAVIKLAKDSTKGAEVITIGHDGLEAPVLLRPAGDGSIQASSVKAFLEEYRKTPEFRKGTARLGDIASYIDHTNRFKDDDSVIFASPNPAKPQLMTVFDYHCATADGEPRNGAHRAVYDFPLSDEWIAWSRAHGQPMNQQAFAEFIENRILDVIEPGGELGPSTAEFARKLGDIEFATPMKVLELSRGLAVRVGTQVKQAVNLSTGEVQVLYETQNNDESGAPLKVPTAFLIAIPVFRSGIMYQVPVRLRYSVRERQIQWRVELHRAEVMLEDAFDEAKKHASKETGLPVFVGTPES